MQSTTAKVVRGTESVTDTRIRGYTSQMLLLQNLISNRGAALRTSTRRHASHVAIIERTFKTTCLQGSMPIGQELRVDGMPYTVIGVSEKRAAPLARARITGWVFCLRPYQKTYGTSKTFDGVHQGWFGGKALDNAADEVRVLVRSAPHDTPGPARLVRTGYHNTLVGFFSTIRTRLERLLADALISLVVGGIVIMNIMLVSVTERTPRSAFARLSARGRRTS